MSDINRSAAAIWIPNLILFLGATLTGVFAARQWKESGSGHTYYEFIATGVALFVVGLVLVYRRRSK